MKDRKLGEQDERPSQYPYMRHITCMGAYVLAANHALLLLWPRVYILILCDSFLLTTAIFYANDRT